MVLMEYLGHGYDDDHEIETDLYLVRLPNLAGWEVLRSDPLWRRVVEESADGAALFIAGDWSGLTNEINEFAAYLLGHGVFWVSTWGPNCEEAHDLFEWAELEAPIPEHGVVMTIWHPDSPIDEGMDLLFWAFADGAMVFGPARIAVSFGEPDWSDAVRRILQLEIARAGTIR